MPKALKWIGITVAGILTLAIVGLLIFRMVWVDFVDYHNLPYKYDRRTGQITVLTDTLVDITTGEKRVAYRTGYIVTAPFLVKVHEIDLRPMQVCISAIQRVLNCKLVKFNPEGIALFLQYHGRGDYENSPDARGNPSTFNEIMKAYAYEGKGKHYPFLTIISELGADSASQQTAPSETQK